MLRTGQVSVTQCRRRCINEGPVSMGVALSHDLLRVSLCCSWLLCCKANFLFAIISKCHFYCTALDVEAIWEYRVCRACVCNHSTLFFPVQIVYIQYYSENYRKSRSILRKGMHRRIITHWRQNPSISSNSHMGRLWNDCRCNICEEDMIL